ncbi:hypothetical protein DXV75_07935 [Alteromonas aestuariivivens]|uniref:Ricin B lectin domain-containing protein n=1 Tax=Alteromonas aestuariivivens TaxID=1938339 RepID=A0A3D8M849_9ALTE|nr:hypothetical protein [Alteromonas aestuariivivens]RDV26007.1 hypothetical protein DXV75_07935 [Alteromonas aestuariivivens]
MTRKIYVVILGVVLMGLGFSTFAAQSVSTLQNSYTGNTTWDAATGTITFTSSGTIALSGRPTYFDTVWEVPTSVQKVVINSGVTVTGQFHFSASATVEGKNKTTSVVYGTPETKYTKNREGVKAFEISTFYISGGTLTVTNLTSLDPKGFHFTARGTDKMNLDGIRAIDSRGGEGNNSDGVVAGDGSVIKNSYFETGDDIFKVYYGTTTYINNEVKMILNAVPIQLGWGTNIDNNAKGIFQGLKVNGDSGRGADGRALIVHREGGLARTIEIDDLVFENQNATVVSQREAGMSLSLTVTNALIDVQQWAGYSNGTVTSNICGSSSKTNYYECRNQGVAAGIKVLDHKASGEHLRYHTSTNTVSLNNNVSIYHQWDLVKTDGEWFRLESEANGNVMGSTDGLNVLHFSASNTGSDYEWKYVAEGDWGRLIHRTSGLRLHIKEDETMFRLGPNTWTGDRTLWQLTPSN